jgi:hypothetical protein
MRRIASSSADVRGLPLPDSVGSVFVELLFRRPRCCTVASTVVLNGRSLVCNDRTSYYWDVEVYLHHCRDLYQCVWVR